MTDNRVNSLHEIFPGDIFSGVISHVIDQETFYVINCKSTVILTEMQEYLEKNVPDIMFWYPACNEKFLININNEYSRAKRIPLIDQSVNHLDDMQMLLIDYGENMLIPLPKSSREMDIYNLPEQYQDIPALAKKCIWMGDKSDENERVDFLKTNVMKNVLTIETVKVIGETLYVKIYPQVDDKEYEKLTEDFKENMNIIVKDDKERVLKAEIEDLYEKSSNNKNAPIAINEYVSEMDEQVLEKQNLQTATSKYHYECKDHIKMVTFKEDFDIIKTENYYEISITFMDKMNNFIFRFNDPDYEIKLDEIQQKINDKKEIKKYKKINSKPKIGQLILARIGGYFYRAKIYDNYNNDDFVVWCLDEGSIKLSKMSSMYDFEMQIQSIEYLTHDMEICNVEPLKVNSKRAMMRIFDFCDYSGPLRALIKQTDPYYKCQLFDQNGTDVGQILIDEGFAIKKEYD